MKKTHKIILPYIDEKYHHKFVGSGMNSNCYLTEDGQLFKEFFNPRNDYFFLKSISEIFDSKHLSLPRTFVFLENNLNELVGYIREYVQGNTFDNLPLGTNINNFIIALNDFEKDLYYNTKHGLLYKDMHAKNMIYNDELIRVIDTESFDFSYDDDKRRLIDSLYELYYTICLEMLCCSRIDDYQAIEIINRSSKIGYSEYLRTSQMLEKLIEYLEKENSCYINTYGDLKNNLVLRKE